MTGGSTRPLASDPTRILFLNPGGSLGGAERCLLDLAASIQQSSFGRSTELGLVVGGDGPLVDEAKLLGMRVWPLPMSAYLARFGDSGLTAHGPHGLPRVGMNLAKALAATPAYVGQLRRAIRSFSPSVIHSNGIKTHLLAALIGGPAPVVWHIRDFVAERPLVSRALRLFAGRAEAAIAISNAVATSTRRILPRLPLSVVYDAIDTGLFTPSGSSADLDDLAGSSPAPSGTVRVGLVATYARWKGHDVFLRAVQHLQAIEDSPPLRFYIVGGPIYDTEASQYRLEELRSMAEGLGIADRVHFVPFQRRVEDVFRALDVVVHSSSRPEPFGRTIAEAMATARPVIVSSEGGAAELFVDGVEAIGMVARNPEALAEAIRALATAAPRRQRIGSAAREAAVRRFSRDRLAAQVFAVYRTLGRG